MQLTVRNNRHVSDIGSLVHEGTDLHFVNRSSHLDKSWTDTYFFYGEAVGKRSNFSKHSFTGSNIMGFAWAVHLHLEQIVCGALLAKKDRN